MKTFADLRAFISDWNSAVLAINSAEGRGCSRALNRRRLVRSPSYRDGVTDVLAEAAVLIDLLDDIESTTTVQSIDGDKFFGKGAK